MRKWSRILFVFSIVAVVGWIAWLALRPSEPEPVYKGKRLSEWLEAYDDKGTTLIYIGTKDRFAAPNEAVRYFGTNAIPTLLRRLQARDSPLTLRLVALARKQQLFEVKFKSAWDKQQEGLHGFAALGADGKVAVAELIKLYEKDSSPDTRYSVTHALSCIGPAASEAVPMLARSLGDTHSEYWSATASALGWIHSRPEISVPALTKCFRDQNADVRRYAVYAITAFGAEAKPAVPDLLKLLSDPDTNVRESAKDALKRIDPEEAAKAGVK